MVVHGWPRVVEREWRHVVLEIKLILHIDSIFYQIAAKTWESLERKPVGRASAASRCNVGIVDDQAVIVRAVERIIDGDAEFFRQVVLLFGRGIHHAIPDGDFKFSWNDIFADLRVPTPGLTQVYRWALDNGGCRGEWNGFIIAASDSLVPVVGFGLNRPALVFSDKIRFIRLKVINAAAQKPAVKAVDNRLANGPIHDIGPDGTQVVLSRIVGIAESNSGLWRPRVKDVSLSITGVSRNLVQESRRIHHFPGQKACVIVIRSG